MTLIITTICADGVVLMTDGRMTKPLQNNAVITDDECKIKKIHQSLYAATFGVELASVTSLIYFGNAINQINLQNTHDVQSCLYNSVKSGWETFKKALPLTVDKYHIAMKNGLILAGFMNLTSFIAGQLYGTNSDAKDFSDKLHSCIILGGEEVNAELFFKNQCGAEMGISGTLKAGDAVTIGAETIRMAEKKDASIGGTIRYVILKLGEDSIIHEY